MCVTNLRKPAIVLWSKKRGGRGQHVRMVLDVLPIPELVDTYWHLETHLLLLHKVAFPILYEAVVTAVVCVHRQSYVSTGEYLCPQV